MYFWITFCCFSSIGQEKKKKGMALIKISIVFALEEGSLFVVVMVISG